MTNPTEAVAKITRVNMVLGLDVSKFLTKMAMDDHRRTPYHVYMKVNNLKNIVFSATDHPTTNTNRMESEIKLDVLLLIEPLNMGSCVRAIDRLTNVATVHQAYSMSKPF